MPSNINTITGSYKINEFLGGLAKTGGISMSNLYEVRFEGFSNDLKNELSQIGFNELSTDPGSAYAMLTLLCEEASLPGIQANTGQTTGVYMGEGQVNYAHTKSFTDITLGWTCDANLLPVKFLNMWMQYTFKDTEGGDTNRFSSTRVSYPDDYMCKKLIVTKAERNNQQTLGRVNGIYTLYDAWPYSIQSTPLSYGASTLLKVTASFYYRRWRFNPYNITNTTAS